ncbi:MAG: ChaN family lipoprotein [Bacteriovoracaceae bacterium]
MQLHSIYRQIHRYIKEKALSFETVGNAELISYQKNLKKIALSPFKFTSLEKMLKTCQESQIVYLGDFHTFDQSSKNLERILKALKKKNKKFILCLEMVHAEYQVYIDSFLAGNLTEREFLESINYHEAWRFPWNHYRALFDLAKKENIPIMGINTKGTLKQRDEFAAGMLSTFLHMDPDARLMVLYGEYHIAHNKIPKDVELKLGNKKIKQTIIQQNLEDVYWRLPKTPRSQLIRFSSGEFHLQTSPPWIKYESMVYWFENLTDDGESDIYLEAVTTGLKSFDANVLDHFSLITKKIHHKLKFKKSDVDLEDFNLYDQTKLTSMTKKIRGMKNKRFQKYYSFLLASHQSFKLPSENTLYCPNYSINRLSYTCGLFVFSHLKNRQGVKREDLLKSKDANDVFSYLLDQSFMGFLFSKIINPSRKCDLYLDLREKMNKSKRENEIANLELSLKFLAAKGSIDLPHGLNELHLIAKNVGHLYAHYFFLWMNKDESDALSFLKSYFEQEHPSHMGPVLLKKTIPMKNLKHEKKQYF